MYISDACKAASTTKKAIEYYCEKGLIKPAATENGYRLFSEEDVARLKKISALRSMGVSVGDIKELLEQNDVAVYGASRRKRAKNSLNRTNSTSFSGNWPLHRIGRPYAKRPRCWR